LPIKLPQKQGALDEHKSENPFNPFTVNPFRMNPLTS
jgi:hypothetical protein